MIFNEIYSTYYLTCEKLIEESQKGELNRRKAIDIIRANAYSESDIAISDKIRNNQWQFIREDGQTAIKNSPKRPASLLELRFLKTMCLDRRMRLFSDELKSEDIELLEAVEPLFNPDDIFYFDQYLDGDDYDSELYISNFRNVRTAIRDKLPVDIKYKGRRGIIHITGVPDRFEYSKKDDKFRVILKEKAHTSSLNMARITDVVISDRPFEYRTHGEGKALRECVCVMRLKDERNALERALLHFAHLKKEAVCVEEDLYDITIWYNSDDETELLIRILSFGPMIRVLKPDSLVGEIKNRLFLQKKLMLNKCEAFFP